MNNVVNQLKWFIGLVLFQVLILNHMHINGYATPFLFIYFILKFQTRTSRNELMLWAFVLGLTVDLFSNTPGMSAAAVTCLAFSRNTLLRMVTLRMLDDDFEPGIKTMGLSPFFRYVMLACALYCTFFLTIDTFSFFHLPILLLKIATSTISTLICIFCMESIGRRRA